MFCVAFLQMALQTTGEPSRLRHLKQSSASVAVWCRKRPLRDPRGGPEI